jgi:hypothetical protein
MNKKLSPTQTIAVFLILLAIAGFAAYRYFAAPAFPGEDPRDKGLHNITISEISITFGDLAPAHVSATEAPRRGGGGGGGGVTPKGEAARIEAARVAKEVTPKYNKLAEGLRQAGIPVSYDDILKKSAEGKARAILLVTLEGNGTVVDGQPTYGVLSYKVEIRRDVFTSPSARAPISVGVYNQTGAVGVTSPETLQQNQDEAITRALRGIIARWKEDNPTPTK